MASDLEDAVPLTQEPDTEHVTPASPEIPGKRASSEAPPPAKRTAGGRRRAAEELSDDEEWRPSKLETPKSPPVVLSGYSQYVPKRFLVLPESKQPKAEDVAEVFGDFIPEVCSFVDKFVAAASPQVMIAWAKPHGPLLAASKQLQAVICRVFEILLLPVLSVPGGSIRPSAVFEGGRKFEQTIKAIGDLLIDEGRQKTWLPRSPRYLQLTLRVLEQLDSDHERAAAINFERFSGGPWDAAHDDEARVCLVMYHQTLRVLVTAMRQDWARDAQASIVASDQLLSTQGSGNSPAPVGYWVVKLCLSCLHCHDERARTGPESFRPLHAALLDPLVELLDLLCSTLGEAGMVSMMLLHHEQLHAVLPVFRKANWALASVAAERALAQQHATE